MRSWSNLRTAFGALLVAIAVLAIVATSPAQPAPPGFPRPPGQGEPTSVPGTPPALPVATLPPQASPAASPAGSPAAGASPPSGSIGAPPAGASGQPTPPAGGSIIRFTGQLLDVRNGYIFFTTSDAFKASPSLRIVNLDASRITLEPAPELYARATLDPASGSIVELALTKRKLPTDAAYQQAYAKAHAFVVAGSPTIAAPELRGVRLTGRPVAVTFYVQVPPTTPLSDSVYITTDASGWIANAMKMDRIDALHYRLTRSYASGTKFAYRYTRGTWTSVEVGEDGLQDDPHQFFVPEVDAKRLTDLVYRWSDQNPAQPDVGPNSIPTPFNPNPFGNLPSGVAHPGIPPASPTPRP